MQQDLIKTIKAHIAKGDKATDKAEQHYIAAGQHLKTLKAEHTGSWSEWEALLRDRVGIGKSRASELMAIADGTKTLAEVRAGTAERTAKAKLLSATSGEKPLPMPPSIRGRQARMELQGTRGPQALRTWHRQNTGPVPALRRSSPLPHGS